MISNNLTEQINNIFHNLQLTKEEVESYQPLLREAKHQRERLQRLNDQGKPSEVIEELMKRLSQSIIKAEKLILKIEIFIGNIEDPRIREILRMKYIDGMTWKQVARAFFIVDHHARRLVNEFFEGKERSARKR